MTRNRVLILSLLVITMAGAYFFLNLRKSGTDPSLSIQNTPPRVDTEKLEINGKKVVGLKPGKEKVEIKKLKVANKPSTSWEKGLKENLLQQGGNSIKDIKFTKIDSFVWAHEGAALFVESVIVTLKNEKNVSTTFRVLVDAQTGKILKNWDQPVIDPVNPREGFRIKIDPRYHTD